MNAIPSGWEAVIGLEIHAQLATRSKIFSGAANAFGAEPNTRACAVDLGLPGVLPVLNAEAVRLAVRFGLAIGAQIARECVFDRKNYFYPDLPKGYQISQLDHPIVGRGTLRVPMPDGSVREIGITRAHLEEDAGKLVHDVLPGRSAVDLNRAGTPLLEIVSEPELRTPEEAGAYMRRIHTLVTWLGVSDGNMAEGSMRCDANVSVRRVGERELGERTEIKNVNSFRFVERAIRHEIARQVEVLESGGRIQRETRLYDAERDETRSMRSKELSEDYRYFPDPDLLPVHIDEAFIEAERAALPELPDARRQRFMDTLGLSAYDADLLVSDVATADYFERVAARGGDAKLAANWINGELASALNRSDATIDTCRVAAESLGDLIARLRDETLSSRTAKVVFEALWQGEADVDAVIRDRDLAQVRDAGALDAIVAGLVEANPEQVEQFRAGKDKVLGFFVGQVMKATGGKADPKQVNELLRRRLAP